MKKIGLLFVAIICFCNNSSVFAQDNDNMFQATKFKNALDVIKANYVDTINTEKLVEDAIVGALKELDPHSVYMSKEEIRKANEPLEGSFDGIGVQFNILDDTIIVVSPITGGPSEKLGVQAGDKIVKVNGEEATGSKITNSWVTEKLKGKKGTKVTITIARWGSKDLIDFEITRDKIPIYSVDASYMLDDKTGCIKVNRFSATTMDEFRTGLKKLNSEGMQNLILDLRGNGGGYLNTANDLADEFLNAGKTIVYTEGTFSKKIVYTSTSKGTWEEGKLIVLIDEGSASASEIVSGAIQDWDRGLIIGRRSFGKGLVQKPFYLTDGSAIRLTTARYHTPTGRCIQKTYKGGVDQYQKDLEKRLEHGEFYHQDSIKFPDSLKYFTPNNRVVYGGGGIMPDIFIPLDTTYSSKFYGDLQRKGVFNQFSLSYIDDSRKKLLAKYPNIKEFKKNFVVDDELLDKFFLAAEKKGIAKVEKDIITSKELIKVQLKSLIARNLFDTGAYFECIIDMDTTMKKALGIINDKNKYQELLTPAKK
ncbi:MAG: S41 family peptidase [Bacteroidota bacterium]